MIYEPAQDSYLLEKTVKLYAKNKRVLDIGTGSGILAQAAVDAGAKKVLAVDIDAECVAEAKKKGIDAMQSDLFQGLNRKEKFDLIVFNPPYLPLDKREDAESARATTGGKKGDEIILRFLKDAPKFIRKNGIILILFSSLTPRKRIIKILKEQGMEYKSVESEKIFMEMLEVWEITTSKS